MSEPATMYIDGASRGNPGKAAYAVVLARPGLPVVEEADTIGTASNNVAEYTALVEGLALAAELGVKSLQVFSDSELLVKQMNGEYKVKNDDLRTLFERAGQLRKQFDRVTLTHVRREQNKRADQIGNEALDGRPRRRGQIAEPNPPTPFPGKEGGAEQKTEGEVAPFGSLAPPSFPGKGVGGLGSSKTVTDAAVRADAVQCLADAARHWATNGVASLPPEAVWEQLWSLLDEAGVLKKRK